MLSMLFTLNLEFFLADKSHDSPKDYRRLVNVKETSRETTLCLAAAHALVKLDDGTVVGDPMEKTTLEALDWALGKGMLLKVKYVIPNLKEVHSGCASTLIHEHTCPPSHPSWHPSSFPILFCPQAHVNGLSPPRRQDYCRRQRCT